MADHPSMKLVALLLVGAACLAAAEGEFAAALLNRTKAKVLANDSQIQNYTCVETIVRDYYRPAASTLEHACSWLLEQRSHPGPAMELQHESTDRLRLDVAGTPRGEIFSWAGASRFSDDYVDRVVHEGPISTGAFGAFLAVIFGTDAKKFTVVGPLTVNGRRFMEYSFDVPQADSHYKVKLLDGNRVPMAYSGVVRVDAETANPVRLIFRSAELPQASGSCQSVASLELPAHQDRRPRTPAGLGSASAIYIPQRPWDREQHHLHVVPRVLE
jgi:hypothetical protein